MQIQGGPQPFAPLRGKPLKGPDPWPWGQALSFCIGGVTLIDCNLQLGLQRDQLI